MKKYFFVLTFNLLMLNAAAQPVVGDYMTINGGLWSLASNWNRHDGVTWQPAISAPTAATAQQITIMNGHTITANANVSADQLVIAAGGTLVVSNNITFTVNNGVGNDLYCAGNLHFVNGIINGNGTSYIQSNMIWETGTIDAIIEIISGGLLTANTSSFKNLNSQLITRAGGTMNWDAGNISFTSGTLTNEGIINNSFDGSFSPVSGSNAINNSGIFNKTNGAGTGTILNTITWNNSGEINVSAGQIFTHASGTMNFNAGTVIAGTGTLHLAGGTHSFTAAFSSSAGSNIKLSGGIMFGGFILTINGTMLWTAGTIDNIG